MGFVGFPDQTYARLRPSSSSRGRLQAGQPPPDDVRYYIRRCSDVKQQLAGSAFISGLDGARGFNLLPNTARAKEVLAVLSDAGCFLPEVLQLGPTSGPYDFQFSVD